MRDRTWSGINSGALLGGCLLMMACGAPTPAPPVSEPDAGTVRLDGGTGNEQPTECAVQAPTACPTPAPRYADVAPIIERRCITCHVGAPGGPWSLADYVHVADWQDTIRASQLDCSMPPPDAGVSMPLEERLALLTWIRCGLPK